MYLTKRAKRRLVILAGVAVLLAIVAVGGLFARSIYRARMADAARERGLAAFASGDFKAALPDLSFAVSREPDDVDLLVAFADTRAKVFEVNGRHLTSAVGLYRAALKLDPDNIKAMEGLLDVYAQLGWRVELEGVANRLLELEAEHIGARRRRLELYYLQGQREKALVDARELGRLEPAQTDWLAVELDLLRAQGATDEELLKRCDEVVAGWSEDGRFRMIRADLLRLLAQDDKGRAAAEEEARAAADLGAADTATLERMSDTLDRLGLRAEADDFVRAAMERMGNDPKAYEVLVRRLWLSNQLEEGLVQIEQARAAIGRDDLMLLQWKVRLLTLNAERDAALATLQALDERIDSAPAEDRQRLHGWSDAMRARLNVEALDWPTLVSRLQEAEITNPTDATLLFFEGSAYTAVDENERAATLFERALQASGGTWIVAGLAECDALLALNRPLEAAILARRLVNARPEAIIALARAWVDLERAGGSFEQVDFGLSRRTDLVGFVGSLYEGTNRAPAMAPILADAYVVADRPEAFRDLALELMGAAQPDTNALLALARISLAAGIGMEENLVAAAEEVGGETLDTAAFRATLLHRQGRSAEGLALIDRVGETMVNPDPAQLARARLQYAAWAGMPEAIGMMRESLEKTSRETPAAAAWVLAQPVTWTDETLAQLAIERLGSTVGQASPRVVLANATWALQFRPEDNQAIAKATLQVNELLRSTPDSLPALTTMSRLLLAGDKPDVNAAIEFLRRAVDDHPTEVSLYPQLISLLQQRGDLTAATRYIEQYGRMGRKDDAQRRLEVALRTRQGDLAGAITQMNAIAKESGDEADQLALASMQATAGQLVEAEKVLRPFVDGDAPNPVAVRALADILVATGRVNEAYELVERPLAGAQPLTQHKLAGSFYLDHGRLDLAQRHVDLGSAIAPEDADVAFLQAQILMRRGKNAEALAAAESGLAASPDHEALLTLAGTLLLMDDARRGEAIERFERLGATQPELAALMKLVDRAAAAKGAVDSTLLADSIALASRSGASLPAWRFAVLLHRDTGRMEEALRLARQAMARFPLAPEPVEWATTILLSDGRYDEALDMARLWRQRSASDPLAADTTIALIQLGNQRPVEALATLKPHESRILEERETAKGRFTTLIAALIMAGQPEHAAALLAGDLRNDAGTQSQWFMIARSATPEAAYAALETAGPAVASTAAGKLGLSAEWLALGRRAEKSSYIDRAAELVGEAAEADANPIAVLQVRATIADARKQFAEAERLYREILAQSPGDVLALNNLALLLSRQPGNEGEAVALIEKAVGLVPDLPDLLDTQAQVLLAADRVAEADKAATQAVALRRDDPTLLLTLAKIKLKQGATDDARRRLSEAERALAASGYPDREIADSARQLRDQLR